MMAFTASFLYVALKAFQQLNVIHHRLALIVPVSYGMAACEVFLVGYIAVAAVGSAGLTEQAWLVFKIGSGAGLGAMFSMLIHKRMSDK